MDKQQVWLAMSFSWAEIGIEEYEYDAYAERIGANRTELGAVRRIVFWEVCGAFAVFTVIALLSMGMALPDWGFEDEYVIKKVSGWLHRPIFFSLLNPLWLLGYPLACLLVLSGWLKLSSSMRRMAEQAAAGDARNAGT